VSTPAGVSEPTAELIALAAALGRQAPPCESHPETWYAPDPSEAIKRCRDCHGKAECAALAVALDERWGVWGGEDHERRKPSRASRQAASRREAS
jgi:WhiB family redox-sensing transcriptional regulator